MREKKIDNTVLKLIKPLFGKKCCRIKVGYLKSLSIGFGKKIYHNNPKLNDDFYGEWEIGTYNCAWRVMKDSTILCGINDPVESLEELNNNINMFEFGNLFSVVHSSDIDIRVKFDTDIFVDFLAASSDEDEYFHIFCPNSKYVEFSKKRGWKIGDSKKPWPI